jgi:hypothetical protein
VFDDPAELSLGQAVIAAQLRTSEIAGETMTTRLITVFGGTGFLGNDAKSAYHSEPSGTDADR